MTYKNPKGEEVEFYLNPFLINSLEGIGEVEADTQTQKAPYQDGESYIESYLQPRFIDMEGQILKRDKKEIREHRRIITRTVNPKYGLGRITFELDGETFVIDAVPEGIPSFPERSMDVWQKFQVSWFCPDPYWRSTNNESKALQAYVGNFKLPMTFPFMLGTSGSSTTLYNDGDAPAPVQIEINGPITNPQIFNRTTGESMRINRTIDKGEVLRIDTTPGRKSITVEGAYGVKQAFGHLDSESTLWKLATGENRIEHVADSGNRHAEVIIHWGNRYSGV